MISFEEAQKHLRYDPATGHLWWKTARKGRAIKYPAGSLDHRGYARVCIDGKIYKAHRIIWFLQTKQWPKYGIDHRNGILNDNRWGNLREATSSQNNMNRRAKQNNSSGFKGVYRAKVSKKWCASIRLNKKERYLGTFSDPKKAHAAYVKAAKKYHGEFARAL